jgi:hypothetical protein
MALVLWQLRRWNARNAALILGISLTFTLFASSLAVVFSNLMNTHRSTAPAVIFSPVLLFLLVATDNLLRFGKPIKSMARRIGSQIAWVLVYFDRDCH